MVGVWSNISEDAGFLTHEELAMDVQSCESRKLDWSSLPQELLEEISACIANFSDHVCFRSVCSSWRSAARPRRLPPHPPLLIVAPYELNSGSCDLFSVSGRMIRLDLPSAVSKQCHGSSYGWLFLQHDVSFLSLVNPFTREEIHLPRLSKTAFIYKAILSSDPCLDPECIALVLQYNTFTFCRVGGDKWTTTGNLQWSHYDIEDIIFYKRKIYVIGRNGRLRYCDVSPCATLTEVPYVHILRGEKMYLVESSGDLYLVTRHVGSSLFRMRTRGFGVFKFVTGGDRWNLLPVVDMKDHVLFVGPFQSVCLDIKDLNGIDGNCIYYVEEYPVDRDVGDIEPKMCKYRLDDDTIEQLQHANRYCFGSPKSLWIIPSVTL